MPPTPVLYIDLAPHPGGSVISLMHLLQGLDREQWRPMVALSRQNKFPEFEAMGIPVARVPTPQREERTEGAVERLRQGKAGASIRSTPGLAAVWHLGGVVRHWRRNVLPVVRALTPIIREFNPALIHLNDSLALVEHGALAARLTHTPAIVHSRSFVATPAHDRRWLAPHLRGMVFISQAVRQFQLQHIPAPRLNRVIPNAVDVSRFQQPVDRAAVRRSLGAPPDAPLIGMIGRIVAWKGQHIFVEAFARLRQRFPQARAIIVGDTDTRQGELYRQEVQARARALGLTEHLSWLGRRPDVPQLLAAIDVLAHCSVQPEPFGRVLIEAMAAGTPVIASRAGGAMEIIEDEVTGLLTPPGDAAGLAAALERLLTNASLRKLLQENGRNIVGQRYDIATHAARIADFYRQALQRETD